jgi:hypothetical protein
MPSTYSPLKIELPATGEQSGTWGNTTNTNLGTALEEAIVGSADVTFTNGNDTTVTLTDSNASQVARNLRLNLIGSSNAAQSLILGSGCQIEKLYLVNNTLGHDITVKNTTGTGIVVPAGKTMFVYNNGTNVVEAVNSAVTLDVTTLDATNIEVTNIKAKDGTASATIANSTGVMTVASSVLTTTDINGGTIDGTTIGGASAAAGNFTTLGATGVATFSAGTVSAPAITTTGDTNTGIFFPAADTIAFSEGGAEVLRINSSGNVVFSGAGSTSITLLNTDGSNRAGLLTSLIYGGSGATGTLTLSSTYGNVNQQRILVGASEITFQIDSTERMRISSAGNVGIGTASPATVLQADSTSAGALSDVLSIRNGDSTANTEVGIFFNPTTQTTNIRGARISAINEGNNNVSLKFYTGAGATLTSKMILDTNGNLGLGTTNTGGSATARALKIFGTATAQFAADNNSFVTSLGSAAAVGYVEVSGANPLTFVTNSGERMRITSAGLVGIGTSSPLYRLQIGDATVSTANRLIFGKAQAASEGNLPAIGQLSAGGVGNDLALAATSTSGVVRFFTGAATSSGEIGTNANAERMRIDSSGLVGIGTSSPTQALTVTGGAGAGALIYSAGSTGGGSLFLRNTQSSDYTWRLAVGGGDNAFVAGRGLFIRDENVGATRLAIDSSGNVGIGTSSPAAKFVVSNAGAGGIEMLTDGTIQSYNRSTSAYQTLRLDGSVLLFRPSGTEAMRIDASGNVGIGTSSPNGRVTIGANANDTALSGTTNTTGLHLYARQFGISQLDSLTSSSSNSGMSLRTYNNGTYTEFIANFQGNTTTFQTAGTERMRIDSSGNVLIGSTSIGTAATRNLTVGTPASVSGGITLWAANTSTHSINFGDGTTGDEQYRGIVEYAHSGDSMRFYTAATERMRIDSSGNLLLGTTSTFGSGSYGFRVSNTATNGFGTVSLKGNRTASEETAGLFQVFNNTTEITRVASQLGADATSGVLTFSTASTGTLAERMRIDSSGNLLVGTTVTEPRNLTSGSGCAIKPNTNAAFEYTSSDASSAFINNTNSASGGATFIGFRQQATTRGSITTNGSSVAYNTTSDYRLKENIAPMTGALNTVKALKPVTYTWKSTGEASQGFIAHELQEVVPDCVTGKKDAVEEDGSIKAQGIDTSFLVATLTAAIQELKATVDAQAARIAALESK